MLIRLREIPSYERHLVPCSSLKRRGRRGRTSPMTALQPPRRTQSVVRVHTAAEERVCYFA